jgi:hypothetical protein
MKQEQGPTYLPPAWHTTVIVLIMEYSREYCSYVDNYEFTLRTIIVTAMTGVAATLLLGETTHSAV